MRFGFYQASTPPSLVVFCSGIIFLWCLYSLPGGYNYVDIPVDSPQDLPISVSLDVH